MAASFDNGSPVHPSAANRSNFETNTQCDQLFFDTDPVLLGPAESPVNPTSTNECRNLSFIKSTLCYKLSQCDPN